jgi:hypothetical protein
MQSVTMELKKKNPKRIKHMRSYANNWQYRWVRRRLLWTEQFWLPGVSYRRWGERKNFATIYCVYPNIRHWQPSTCRKILEQNIITFVRDYKDTAPTQSHPQLFSDNGLGKKSSYYSVPFLFFLIQR